MTRTLGIAGPGWNAAGKANLLFLISFLFFRSKQTSILLHCMKYNAVCVSYTAQAGLKLSCVFSLLCVYVGVHLSAGAQGEQRGQIPLEKVKL